MSNNFNLFLPEFTNEFKLLLESSVSQPSDNDIEVLTERLKCKVNWPSFFEMIDRHRMIPYVFDNLKVKKTSIPEGIFLDMKSRFEKNQVKMLALGGEMVRISNVFKENSIPILFFKGPVLSIQLYGDVAKRQSRDIDTIVKQTDADKAHEILLHNGYNRIAPSINLSPKQNEVNYRVKSESAYMHKSKHIILELHWKLFNFPCLLPLHHFDPWDKPTTVQFGENSIDTINPFFLAHYLSTHGSFHFWFRLFWLKDFATLINTWNEKEWKKEWELALASGTERTFAQSSILANLFFGTKIIPDIYSYSKGNKVIFQSVNKSVKSILASEKENTSGGFHKLNNLFYFMKLRKPLKHKIRCLAYERTSYVDWQILSLPDRLFFLYYILRPFLMIYGRIRMKWKAISQG
jgi:hypothetical protein